MWSTSTYSNLSKTNDILTFKVIYNFFFSGVQEVKFKYDINSWMLSNRNLEGTYY